MSYNDESYLHTLTKKQLQDILRTRNDVISGNKPELIKRILETTEPSYPPVHGSVAFEHMMDCFEAWCREREYDLYKQTTSVKFEIVSKNELRHYMEGVETPKEFLDRFWECWMSESWGMYDVHDEQDFSDSTFMREFREKCENNT